MDIKKFRARAARKKEKLTVFLEKFDRLVPPGLPALVAAADKEVWQEVQCMECANCCKTMTPILTPADNKRIAAHLGLTVAAFREQYLKQEEGTGDWVVKSQPCPLLKDNKCSIYEVRPSDCAHFPHHHKKPFDAYNDTFRNNLVHCPATLLLVEKLEKTITEQFEF
jgi:uncharacterized protein